MLHRRRILFLSLLLATYCLITAASYSGQFVSPAYAQADQPIAGLTASNDGAKEAGQEVTLSAAIVAGTNVNYTWNFGDGQSAGPIAVKDVKHIYTSPGRYTATVIARNSVSQVLATTNVVINVPPITNLQVVSDSPSVLGVPTNFSASIGTGINVKFKWNFGDGQEAEGQNVSHLYSKMGKYTVSVTAYSDLNNNDVQDDNEVTATTTLEVSVTEPKLPDLQILIVGDRRVNAELFFQASVRSESINYTWVMGDGTTLSGVDVTHTYEEEGVFTVVLIASNSADVQVVTELVTISGTQPEKIENLQAFNGTSLSNPQATESFVTFAAIPEKGTDATYVWDFGDGDGATGQVVNHSYLRGGRYLAKVTASNVINTETAYSVVHVSDGGQNLPIFGSDIPFECSGGKQLTNGLYAILEGRAIRCEILGVAADSTDTYEWDLGDGSAKVDLNVITHIYAENGRHVIRIIQRDKNARIIAIANVFVVVNEALNLPLICKNGRCEIGAIKGLDPSPTPTLMPTTTPTPMPTETSTPTPTSTSIVPGTVTATPTSSATPNGSVVLPPPTEP
ncbi:MAG: PKD domain-containing protein [Caldilineaceae bacterium]|nr:PKD domain-containing protein [Caldilineaceae bacterium]